MAMVVDNSGEEDGMAFKRQSLETVAAEFEKRAMQSVVKGDHARALLQLPKLTASCCGCGLTMPPTSAEGMMGLALKHAAKAEEAEAAGKPNTALELYEQALNLFRYHFQGDTARSQDRQQAKVTMQVFRHALNRRDILSHELSQKAQAAPQSLQKQQSHFDLFKGVRALLAPDPSERSPVRGANHSGSSSPIFGYSVQRSASHDSSD
eukprot:jgi/Chlat1/873/Chrsp107S01339